MIELKNSKTIYLGRASGGDKYSLNAFIGAVQMREPEGVWQDIKPQLIRDADGWHIEGAPYYAEIKDDGSRLFCPDKNEKSKYLHLPGIALFSGLARNVVSNPNKLNNLFLPNQITLPTAWGEIRIIFSNTGMHFEILFQEAPPSAVFGKDSPRILLDAEAVGYDIEQLLISTSGIGIPRPRLMAANPEVLLSEKQDKWLDWSYKNGQLELGFDFGELPFPILLKNTTVDVQVGAGASDGYRNGATGFNVSGNFIYNGGIGSTGYHAFYRWTGVTISGTIDTSYIQLYRYSNSVGSPLLKVYGVDEDNPAAPTTYSEFDADPLTTAGVDWDGPLASGWNTSPSLNSIFQELVNSYTISGDAILLQERDDGSVTNNYNNIYSYNGSSAYAAKLHIEYTGGGATAKTSAETGSGADGSSLLATIARGDTGGGIESAAGRGLSIKDYGDGVDALTALIAAVLAAETGSGIEQSALTSILAKLSAEAGSGVDIAGLAARLVSSEVGLGADTGMILGLKSIFGGDGGIGYDALKALIESAKAGADMKLPGRLGQVRIPSKGVSL